MSRILKGTLQIFQTVKISTKDTLIQKENKISIHRRYRKNIQWSLL